MRELLLIAGVVFLPNACAEEQSERPQDPALEMKFCGLMGCHDEVVLKLERPLVRRGTYTLEVSSSRNGVCHFTIPIRHGARAECSGGLELDVSEDGSLRGLRLFGRPARLEVVLTSSAGIARAQVEPLAYRKIQPNGPTCEPTCAIASHEISLSAPQAP